MARYRRAVAPLLYWAREREAIRRRKEAGEPPPHTRDPILAKYRFCNLRRRDDRVSRWLIENLLSHYENFEDQEVFIKWVALCRWVNWPPTLLAIMEAGLVTWDYIDLPAIGKFIDERDGKTWTGAYMVRAPRRGTAGLVPGKGAFIAEQVVDRGLSEHYPTICNALDVNSLQAVCKALQTVPNWGSFMAGQVATDLTYSSLLCKAHDRFGWAPQGPGSRRGYNRIIGQPLNTRVPEQDWLIRLVEWRQELIDTLGSAYQDLTLMDCQNALCEYDKYARVMCGEGRPRSNYKPETAY